MIKDQNNNKYNTDSYLKARQKSCSIKTARKYVLCRKARMSSKYLNRLCRPLEIANEMEKDLNEFPRKRSFGRDIDI